MLNAAFAMAVLHKGEMGVTRRRGRIRKKLLKCYILSMAVYGAETWALRAAHQKYLESFEMWSWRKMEISWTDHVRNEEVLLRVSEQRNILHEIRKRKTN